MPRAAGVPPADDTITLALCGDVMPGRGIDQILKHPGDPVLYEDYVRSAITYVDLAERAHGTIPRRVAPDYVWGDALSALRERAQLRIVNLETSITASRSYAPKGINYKMNPENADCLVAARLDCCLLANNHVLDWGIDGLLDTLATLQAAGIRTAGAGRDAEEAESPAVLEAPGGGRVIVVACGAGSAGVPEDWAATAERPGVHFLPDLAPATAVALGEPVRRLRRPGDIALISLHWGPNWGYAIPKDMQAFAHALVDLGGFDLVFGHSSHHPKGFEIHHGKLILYGAGDFLDDYEGIGGYEAYRADLVCLYLAGLSRGTARLDRLDINPFRIRRFRLEAPDEDERRWLAERLDRESRGFGAEVVEQPGGVFAARW